MTQRVDHYHILGVTRDASPRDIRRAYRRLARQHHPDQNPDPESAARFRALADAYAILADADQRARYDHTPHDQLTQPVRMQPRSEHRPMPTRHGILELSRREAQLVARSGLTLATAEGTNITLPAKTRDGDRIQINTAHEIILLTVRVIYRT